MHPWKKLLPTHRQTSSARSHIHVLSVANEERERNASEWSATIDGDKRKWLVSSVERTMGDCFRRRRRR